MKILSPSLTTDDKVVSLSLDMVRMDAHGRASILDFARLLTGCTAAEASALVRRLLEKEPELAANVENIQINGL